MTESPQSDAYHQLVHRIDPDATLLRAWPLTGGVSAQVTALQIERADGQRLKLIVRRHGNVDLAQNPHEFRLLEMAHARGLAVPKPYYVDEVCELFPTPILVVEYIDGETEFAPDDLAGYLTQMATVLAKIHGVPDSPELAFLPRQDRGFGERPAILDTSLSEDRIRDALESVWPIAQANPAALLHGDYWPGNILWRDGRLAAVIDWEDARVGDPLADLGNARLEVLWTFGPDAMRDFTNHYLALTSPDLTNLAYWDLCAALRPCGKLAGWGLDAATEQWMRTRHHDFVAAAIARLPASLPDRTRTDVRHPAGVPRQRTARPPN